MTRVAPSGRKHSRMAPRLVLAILTGAFLLLAPVATQTALAGGSLLGSDLLDLQSESEGTSEPREAGSEDEGDAPERTAQESEPRAEDDTVASEEDAGSDPEPDGPRGSTGDSEDDAPPRDDGGDSDANHSQLNLQLGPVTVTGCVDLPLLDARCGAAPVPGETPSETQRGGDRTDGTAPPTAGAPAPAGPGSDAPATPAQRSALADAAVKSISGSTLMVLLAWTLFVASPGRSGLGMVRPERRRATSAPDPSGASVDVGPLRGRRDATSPERAASASRR